MSKYNIEDFIISCAVEKQAIKRSVEKFHKWDEDIVTDEEIKELDTWVDEVLAKSNTTREEWFQNERS